MKEVIYSGNIISAGMAHGKAFVISTPRLESIPFTSIHEDEVTSEKEKLWNAIEVSVSELKTLAKRVKIQVGEKESHVFEAHILMLKDHRFSSRMIERIDFEKVNAETAVVQTVQELIQSFAGHGEGLRQKFALDFRDLGLRLIRNLSPFFSYDKAQDLEEPVMIVARELTPSVVARIDRQKILGFVCEEGQSSTHAGILVDAIHVPAIAGVKDFFQIKNGDRVFLDAREGTLWVNPAQKAEDIFLQSYQNYCEILKSMHEEEEEGITKDGRLIYFWANVWMPADLALAQAMGANGIGLIRSEFAYLFQKNLPSEESIFEYYREVLDKVWTGPAHIRLLDVGGETDIVSLKGNTASKAMGLKFLLEEKTLLETQLRALLRASVDKKVYVVYPFFESLNELQEANAILECVKKKLRDQKIPFNEALGVGALIETPEAVHQIEAILKNVSSVIVGSNDLLLKSKGLERNQKIQEINAEMLPVDFLKMIYRMVKASQEAKKDLYFSGQMAENPLCLGLLIGLGIIHFNLSSASIRALKKWLGNVSYANLVNTAQKAMQVK